MKRFLIAVAAVAAVGVVVLVARDNEPPDTKGAAECETELAEAFEAWEEAGFSGSVAVSSGGEFDCLGGYGLADDAADTPNTPDTVFSIGSVSKAFTAAAILRLADDGELSLTDRAGELVPGLAGPAADATVEQLLLHTSGIRGSLGEDYEPLGRSKALAAIGGLELAFEPGSDYLYSNAGYTLLALIVEEVSGMGFREYTASQVLPLPDGAFAGGFWNGEPRAPEPRALGYLDDGSTGEPGDFEGPYWATDGNGSLAMTTRDLASWTRALFKGRLLNPESIEAIAGGLAFDRGDGRSETPGWVAFDDSTYGEPALATAGGGGDEGQNAVAVWLPESERAIAIASNTPAVTAEELLEAVGPSLVAGDPLPRPEVPIADLDEAELAAVAGTYRLETGGKFKADVREDGLAISARGSDAVAVLFPLPDRAGFAPDDVSAHEEAVLALLAGNKDEGRKEREVLESDFGQIEAVEPAGTIIADGELRSYVTITSGAETVQLWYALDEEGGIAAVEIVDRGPTLLVVPSGDGEYRPGDPTGAAPDIRVAFTNGEMTITGASGSARARSGG